MRCIHVSEVEGKPALCYETGLNPRSFARTKMSQNSLIEPGYVVLPDGTKKTWKAAGVNEENGLMKVWGVPFSGERLDGLLNEIGSIQKQASSQQTALQAVVFWIRAKLLLGDIDSTLNPGAAFISFSDNLKNQPTGSVFFGPKNLSQKCLMVERIELDSYNCPDLEGMEAVAFCAAVMLFKVLGQSLPYSTTANIYQDMREGVFLPPYLAIPGLDKNVSNLINKALLLPVEKKRPPESGTDILSSLLKILMNKDGEIADVPSLFHTVQTDEFTRLEKEKKSFLFKQRITVRTQRFYVRNKLALAGVGIALLFLVFVTANMNQGRRLRPTTEGLSALAVVSSYYDAFSNLNHAFMEAAVHGADKSDINVALNLFAISRVRQSHEQSPNAVIINARVWQDLGGQLPSPDTFGVTDLTIELLGGAEETGIMVYRTNYLLWFPNEQEPSRRSDEVTVRLVRGRWRITEILRTITF